MPERVADLRSDGLAALTYHLNWRLILDHQSYFQAADGPSALEHLWSLSIEEQFYLVWPAVLVIMLKCGASTKTVLLATAGLAIVSASVPALAGTDDWHRLYYSTDYRIHGLLIGSCAGTMFASGRIQPAHVRHPLFGIALCAAVFYVGSLMLFASDKAAMLFHVGYPAVGVSFTLIVVACTFVDRGLPLRVLGHGLMLYIGKRSYAIYLWHLPLAIWFRHLDAPLQLIVAGGLTLAAAELSYRLVERPALSLRSRLEAPRMAASGPTPAPVVEALPQVAA
jgi:peptidoglycan/LPS O-acetylase OafA/YrhL